MATMHPGYLWPIGVLFAAVCASAAEMPPMSPQARAGIDRALGTKGVYVQEESARAGTSRPDATPPGAVTAPVTNNIDPAPLNAALSMRGVVADGIYRATIGRIAIVDGTPIGREMGMSTSIVIFGTNDRAFVQADMIVSPDELQRVLKALRGRDFTVTSIRKHTVGEHPESIFISVWKQAAALELARGLRFALDVEVGAAKVASNSGRPQ